MSKLRDDHGGVRLEREEWCPDESYGPRHPSRLEIEREMDLNTRNDILRMACEEVGAEEIAACVWLFPGDGGEYLRQMRVDHIGFLPCVASLLVARVWDKHAGNFEYSDALSTLHRGSGLLFAPPMTCITAALIALGRLTVEQALEVE